MPHFPQFTARLSLQGPRLRSRLKHITQGEAKLGERNPGIIVDYKLAREARERLITLSSATRAGFFTTVTRGSARKASHHPGAISLARYRGQ